MAADGTPGAATATAATSPATTPATLARRMGLFTLILYGVGDMVGSGIYGMIGVAAQRMGNAVWMAFAGSLVAAMLTGLSYASLASRYPRAAGAAFITQRAYGITFLSYVIGLTVVASGLTSMATNSNVFSGILHEVGTGRAVFGAVPAWVIMILFVGCMTAINLRGIRESMWVNALCTLIEVGGLLFVVVVGVRYWGSVNYLELPPLSSGAVGDAVMTTSDVTTGVASGRRFDPMLLASGAVLTFFAFIGFEDMLNVSEEVKEPRRTMPVGMVFALVITGVLYLAVSITAVSVVPYTELGDASLGAPLEQITSRAAPWLPGWVFTGITLFAVANTVLINFVMGSRMLYGMARQGLVPTRLARINRARRTPHVAILVLTAIVIVLALVGNIAALASATSLLMLVVFTVVNAALVILKRRRPGERGGFEIPAVIPILGAIVCAALVLVRLARITEPGEWLAPVLAAALIGAIAVFYLIMRPSVIEEEGTFDPAHE